MDGYMRKLKKKGFTLTELMVVLVILSIITAIAVPFFINYWRRAEFRKNEENAKTIYLAAESKLTYYRSSGQWEQFKKQVKAKGLPYENNSLTEGGTIYAVTLDVNAYKDADKNDPVLKLLDDYTYDKDIFKGAIGIEIDIDSGEVYSAFYATKCKGLNYASEDENHYLTMTKRDYESRSKRLLGYYSAEDTVNVVNLKPVRLRITTISLQNSERLSLNWSSNVGDALDVSYEIGFFKSGDKTKLFTMTVSPYDMRSNGWSADSSGTACMAKLELKDKEGNSKDVWEFPVTYSDNRYSLVLDAMMSAKVQAAIEAQTSENNKTALERTSSISITRLGEVASDLKQMQDIYATVKAVPYSGSQKVTSTVEYRDSEPVSSNTANTLYADESKGSDVKVAAFRHLANMEYYDSQTKAVFTLTNKNMDWASVGTGVYDFTTGKDQSDNSIEKIIWTENSKEKTIDFPSVKVLSVNHTLKGQGKKTLVSNLKLGADSVLDDGTADKLTASRTVYIGLFQEIEGTMEDVTMKDPTLEIASTEDGKAYRGLNGAGILAGRSSGTLKNVIIQTTDADKEIVNADLSGQNSNTVGVGGMVGILAGKDSNGLVTLQEGGADGLSIAGKVTAVLPSTQDQVAENYQCGVGGIVGYAKLDNISGSAKIQNCENHAEVSGNYFAGGVTGKLEGTFSDSTSNSDSGLDKIANIINSSSDGMIVCTEDISDTSLNGRYFGGISGYAQNSLISGGSSASGRASGFTYSADKKNLLKGEYVGGIVGYGNHTLLNNCSTEKDGYILGSDYVGGIAGGLGGGVNEAIQADSTAQVTTNRSYVIGNNYVGGIVGSNRENVVLKNCINNGLAAGYEKYVGGIVGYNEKNAEIKDSASYLSDYDNSVFDMIVNDWKTTADYVGGIAGYNNGKITFTNESEAITVKSVSSVVVGNNYVGGIAGFNDTDSELNVHYELIGGRIYAYGDCAGGGFGINTSADVLTQKLTIKPRSVQGRYFVGGCIGANVVDLPSDITMSGFRADNSLGTITGDAFCGGLIGYQRTYSADQLGGKSEEEGVTDLLPSISENNLIPSATLSTNRYALTIATDGNNEASLNVETNNIPIRADLYVGGIVGYCEKNSNLLIKNCKNAGNLTQRGLMHSSGITLGTYAASSELNVNTANLSDEAKAVNLHFTGGILGVNLENQVIDHCTNTGSMAGYSGIGGIVGLNAGLVYDCELTAHFGNTALNYVGGISGMNIGDTALSKNYNGEPYQPGTIEKCSTQEKRTISGNSTVGGIVGWNLTDGILKENTSYANVSGMGDYVGGIVGRNSAVISLGNDNANIARTVSSSSGVGVGGIVGVNEASGSITASGSENSQEIIALGEGASVSGQEKVGGIVGINNGSFGTDGTKYLTCKATRVRAARGTVGGIAGVTSGDITYAINRAKNVTADSGLAGGITAANNDETKTIANCKGYGSVSSSSGHASGIVSENAGTIRDCVVGEDGQEVVIHSLGVEESGAICAVNTGTITDSKVEGTNVILRGDARILGGITGTNTGIITSSDESYKLAAMPVIDSSASWLTVGGVAGLNQKTITNISAELSFEGFKNYQYLGGITGKNDSGAEVTDCTYTGTITESAGAAGNCYGGIAGINEATLQNDQVARINMTIQGVYSATSSSSAEQKEAQATHAGGIAGKNEEDGHILECTLADDATSSLTAESGMLGGVTGFNKGEIVMSGSAKTTAIIQSDDDANTLDQLHQRSHENGLKEDGTASDGSDKYVNYGSWGGNDKKYSDGSSITSGRLQMQVNANGNVGGITAFNGTNGSVNKCVSGNWFILNKSQAIGVGTGGIIGMNESEKDSTYLINGAFVGRELATGVTNRFAGGIIGNQNNSTTQDWNIENCINYGTIYCYNTHYSGGIMGQWTGTGGTIKNCRNYGTLQTTLQYGWVGAASGIVAELYHAYENNTYNIISCSNYGSIFKANGSGGQGANDSAGILGNITTYKTSNISRGQSFNVQIIDCVNGPGVKIYSHSMASGIFGFLSCDDADNTPIQTSTQNVKIRIERCRNFADVLNGGNFSAGIFGDRYCEANAAGDGWTKNTVVKDCYSFNLNADHYNYTKYPIYSAASQYTEKGRPASMPEEDRKNNYYLDGTNANEKWAFTNVQISKDKAGSGSAGNGLNANGLNSPGRGGSQSFDTYTCDYFFMKDIDKSQYFAAYIQSKKTVNGSTCRLDGRYIKDGDTVIGEVLFYVSDTPEWDKMFNDYLKNQDSTLVADQRYSYKRVEGITTSESGKEQILAPASAKATVANGRITMEITAKNLPDSVPEQLCDPFAYVVTITDENGTVATRTIYSENESFDVPPELSGTLTSISVRAKSMYDEVEDSEEVFSTMIQGEGTMPVPDVRIELIKKGNGSGQYTYQYSLNNLDDYKKYSGWQVKVTIFGRNESVTLNEANPTGTLNIGYDEKWYQINAQATIADSEQSSSLISVPVYLPNYQPQIKVGTSNGKDRVQVTTTLSGNTQDELKLDVTLVGTNTEVVETPTIYRAELVGTWKSGTDAKQNVVFASTDMMSVSKGNAVATFANLPDYLRDASDLKLRLWYSQSGLGPVYTYHDVDLSGSGTSGNANINEFAGYDENGNETWKYQYSTVLENNSNYFNDYIYQSDTLWTWLRAPQLEEVGTALKPEYGDNGEIYYTFKWDSDLPATEDASYSVALVGIDSDGKEVMIDTADSYTGGRSLRIEGTDWNYKEVKLTVTRIGDATKKQIGLSSSGSYTIRPRLASPSQPMVENIDENELDYRVTWSPIASETGCRGYQVYVQPYEDDVLGDEKVIGDVIPTSAQENGTYTTTINLEDYAGKRIVVYLVAKADEDGEYIDSLPGVTYELQIPERLAAPNVTWQVNWTYDQANPVEADSFRQKGLQVSLTADDNSIPPGGSAYLFKAYIYNSQEDAINAANDDSIGHIAEYPGGSTPVQMDARNSKEYYHNFENLSIQYAGKWIVFYARISSGGGNISSYWVRADRPVQLPYVKLKTPEVSSDSKDYEVTATVTESPDLPGEEVTWKAKHTILTWDSVECAEMFGIHLSGSMTDSEAENGKKDLDAQIRVTEQDDHTLKIEQYVEQLNEETNEMEWVWQQVEEDQVDYPEDTPETEKVHTFKLSSYSVPISSNYRSSSGAEIYYELHLQAELEAVQKEDGSYQYTLKLPDAEEMTTADDEIISHTDFSVTSSVKIYADVTANIDGSSDAYVASDENEIKWNK